MSTNIEFPQAARTNEGVIDIQFELTRSQFNTITSQIVERSLETCKDAMDLCQLEPTDLHAVFLSGGTSYIPIIREAVGRYFGKAPKVAVPPERAVVIGAAIHAARLRSEKIHLV